MTPINSPCPNAADDFSDSTLAPHLPATAPHYCPLYDHECTCCGPCANLCAIASRHILDHTAVATILVAGDKGEIMIEYVDLGEEDSYGE